MKNILILFLLLFFVVDLSAKETVFKNDYTIWKDADILIWTKDSNLVVSPKELCLSLKELMPLLESPSAVLLANGNAIL